MAALLSAASETRPVFWHFVIWLRVLWYLLAGLSVLVFGYGLARPIAKYRRGAGERLPPKRELATRLLTGLRSLLAHRTIARRDRTAGCRPDRGARRTAQLEPPLEPRSRADLS